MIDFGVTRLGVHAGPALVGNFGGGRLFDYTAYGDTINTAARLRAANKRLGTRICVSAAVVDGAARFQGRPVGDLMLRGRSEPLRAYEPLSRRSSKACDGAIRRGVRQARSRGIPQRCRRSPRWSAAFREDSSRDTISGDCWMAPRAFKSSWNNGIKSRPSWADCRSEIRMVGMSLRGTELTVRLVWRVMSVVRG